MQIITTHKNVDFDALASVFAASFLYPQATPVLPKSLNPNVRGFLSIHKDLLRAKPLEEIDLPGVSRLVVVDANRWDRLEGVAGLRHRSDLAIDLWDHHGTDGDICADLSHCETTGATVSLFVRELADKSISLSPIQATLFLAGIYEDTGNLTFPTTSPADARAVCFLLEQDADLDLIGSFLRPVYGPKQKDLLFAMLQKAERQKISGHTISINRVEVTGHTPGLALVVNMYQDIVNVTAAFGIFVNPAREQSMVIGRSAGEDLNIGVIMRSMGGGGHRNAGSASVKGASPETIEKWIVEAIQRGASDAVQISDLMSFPVFTISPDVTMKAAALRLRETGCTGLPVVDGDRVVGILSRRDFTRIKKEKHIDFPVKSFMSRAVHHITPLTPVGSVARLMVRNDIGRLPVLDGTRLVGIITRSDIMEYYYDMLPGELSQHHRDAPAIVPD